jgi:hypothetical protein
MTFKAVRFYELVGVSGVGIRICVSCLLVELLCIVYKRPSRISETTAGCFGNVNVLNAL